MAIFQNILKQSALYSVATIASRLSAVILLPVYTRFLTPSDYGVLELLSVTQVFAELLVGMRLGEALMYFYSRAASKDAAPGEEAEAQRRAVRTAITGALMLSALTMAAGWLLAPQLSVLILGDVSYERLVKITFLGVAAAFPAEVGYSYLRVRNEALHYTMAAMGRLVVSGGLAVLFLAGMGMGLEGVCWAASLSAVTNAAYIVVRCGMWMGFGLDRALFREQMKYSLPLAAGALMIAFVHYGDRFFLRRYAPMSEIGLYSLGYKIAMIVSFVQNPYAVFWNSQMYQIVRGHRGEEVYSRLLTYLTLTLTGTALALVFLARPLIRTLATGEYLGAAAFVLPLTAAYVLRGVSDQLRSIFNIENRTVKSAQVSFVGFLACAVLYSTLIPAFGAPGAAWATFAAFAAMTVVSYVLAQRVKRHDFEVGRLAILAAVSAAALAGFRFGPQPAGFLASWACGLGWLLAWAAGLVATGFFTKDERAFVMAKARGRAW